MTETGTGEKRRRNLLFFPAHSQILVLWSITHFMPTPPVIGSLPK